MKIPIFLLHKQDFMYIVLELAFLVTIFFGNSDSSALIALPCLKRMIVEYAIMWAFHNLFPSGWTLSLSVYFLLL